MDKEISISLIEEQFKGKEKLIEPNVKALNIGYNYAEENFKDNNFSIQHVGFEELDSINSANEADGILFDFGLCSTHYDNPSSGFSFTEAGPLAMRLDLRQPNKHALLPS